LTLRGIIISNGSKMALVQSGKERTYLRVAEGDLLGHRLVVAIEHDHVSLAGGGVEQILWLKDLTGRDRRRLPPATAQREPTQTTTRAHVGAPQNARNDPSAAGSSGDPQQPSESSGPIQNQ
jgi:type II secretory pathway component PulC